MRRSKILEAAACAALAIANPPLAVAQEPAQESSAQALERELTERDAIIADLLERVEQLERALGVQPGRGEHAMQPDQHLPTGAGAAMPGQPPVRETSFAQADADRALERTLVQAGALLLPAGAFEIAPQFGHSRHVATAPVFIFEDDATLVGTLEQQRNRYTAGVQLRAGLPLDSQIEVEVPYLIVNRKQITRAGFEPIGVTRDSGSAIGDVTIALAHTLLRERGWLPDLVGRVRWNTGSASLADNGVTLGGGFASLGGSLTAIKRQDPLVFVGSVSYESFFAEKGIDPGEVYGVSIGALLAASPETSLRLSLDQQFQSAFRLDGMTIEGSGQTVAFLTAGASSLLHRGVLLDIAARFGLTDESPDYGVVVTLPIRF